MRNLTTILFALLLFGCTKDKFHTAEQSQYPADVAAIINNKCSTAGCHNTQSSVNAGGLDFSTWDNMFKGGKNGSSVIPFSVDYSYALYFTNTDTLLGESLLPRMPYNQPALSKNEYLTIQNWIANGAPNREGFVKFSDDPHRKKFYVCMQGCDKVAVFDAATRVIMRYVSVGADPNTNEAPHDISITPDGKYWALAFYWGKVVQFFNTSDDKLVATIDLQTPLGTWNVITFTPDSRKAFISSFAGSEVVAQVDIPSFTWEFNLTTKSPHGLCVNEDGSILYITNQYSNYITKLYLTGPQAYSSDPVQLNQWSPTIDENPHQIELSPDGSKYFVSCQATNEVRVFQTSNDSLLKVIPVGVFPQELEVSHKQPYIFVSCKEDSVTFGPSEHGSIYRINYNTYEVKALHCGWQPHGFDVDDDHNMIYVANLNYSNGPAPHHITGCGGRNGYITIIDMNTWELLQVPCSDGSFYTYKNEVLPYPYEVAYRN